MVRFSEKQDALKSSNQEFFEDFKFYFELFLKTIRLYFAYQLLGLKIFISKNVRMTINYCKKIQSICLKEIIFDLNVYFLNDLI
jgi:hypothetical protein